MPSPSHRRAGKQAQLPGCVVAVAQGMQAHGAGPGVPCVPVPSMDVESDPAGPYSHPQGDGQSWPGQLLCPPCPWAPHPALLLPARQRNELCPQRRLRSPAWAAARPQCQRPPAAPQPAGHHARAPGHPFPALLPGRLRGQLPACGQHGTCGARQGQPGLLPSTALPHSSAWHGTAQRPTALPFFEGPGDCNATMRLPLRAGCPPTGESAIRGGCPPGRGPQMPTRAPSPTVLSLALAGAPRFNPCHAAAHHGQLRQSGQAAPSHPCAHPVLSATATGLSQW